MASNLYKAPGLILEGSWTKKSLFERQNEKQRWSEGKKVEWQLRENAPRTCGLTSWLPVMTENGLSRKPGRLALWFSGLNSLWHLRHIGAGSNHGCFTSDLDPCKYTLEISGRWPTGTCASTTQRQDSNGVPISWLWPGPALAVVIWWVNQYMKDVKHLFLIYSVPLCVTPGKKGIQLFFFKKNGGENNF